MLWEDHAALNAMSPRRNRRATRIPRFRPRIWSSLAPIFRGGLFRRIDFPFPTRTRSPHANIGIAIGAPQIGPRVRKSAREMPALTAGVAPVEEASAPSARSNSMERLPDQAAGGEPPIRTDSQIRAGRYQEDRASRDRFRVMPFPSPDEQNPYAATRADLEAAFAKPGHSTLF